jgi:hypothetical protein
MFSPNCCRTGGISIGGNVGAAKIDPAIPRIEILTADI